MLAPGGVKIRGSAFSAPSVGRSSPAAAATSSAATIGADAKGTDDEEHAPPLQPVRRRNASGPASAVGPAMYGVTRDRHTHGPWIGDASAPYRERDRLAAEAANFVSSHERSSATLDSPWLDEGFEHEPGSYGLGPYVRPPWWWTLHVVGYLAAGYIAGLASEASFNASANFDDASPKLSDVVHDWAGRADFTQESSLWFALPDKILLTVMSATAGLVFSQGWRRSAMLAAEFARLHAALMLMRAALILVTTVPSPVSACRNCADLPHTGFLLLQVYCNDCMFSGHCSFYWQCACFWLLSRAATWSKLLVMVAVVAGSVATTAIRDHYTMDVLVAIYVTVPLVLLRRRRIRALFTIDGKGL